MPANLHAEGIDRILQQADRLFDSFRSVAVQEFRGSDQFRSHRMESSKARSVYSPAWRNEGRFPKPHRSGRARTVSLGAVNRGIVRAQSRLNHLKTDRRDLLQPFLLSTVFG